MKEILSKLVEGNNLTKEEAMRAQAIDSGEAIAVLDRLVKLTNQ